MRSLRLALLLFLAAPGVAWAADARITSQDLPIGVVRSLAAAVAPQRFDLVAFHWQGSGHVARNEALDEALYVLARETDDRAIREGGASHAP